VGTTSFLVLFIAGALLVSSALLRDRHRLDADDYVLTGVTGTMTVAALGEPTGEIVFSQGGTRCCSAARSADGRPIRKGTRVVVLWYERGVAYVQPASILGLGESNDS